MPLAVLATRAPGAPRRPSASRCSQDARVDPLALAVTIGLTALAGIACGVLPALHLSHGDRGKALAGATHQRSAWRSSASARNALVVAEVALACVLLVGAGLLFRSFRRSAAGRARLPAAARDGVARRHTRAGSPQQPSDATLLRRRAAARRGAARGRGRRPERHPAARPQPHLGRGRGRRPVSGGPVPARLPAHRRPALPAGDADPARRRPLLRRARRRDRRKGGHHQREPGAAAVARSRRRRPADGRRTAART